MLDAWLRKVPSVRIQGMHKNTLRPFGEGTVVHQQTNGVAIWLCWENYRQRHLFLGLSGPRLRRHLSKVSPPADGSPVCMNGQYATPPHHMHELQPGRPPPSAHPSSDRRHDSRIWIPSAKRVMRSVKSCCHRSVNMAQSITIMASHRPQKEFQRVGVLCPPRRITGVHLCRSYRTAYQRTCREEHSIQPAPPKRRWAKLNTEDTRPLPPPIQHKQSQKKRTRLRTECMWPMESNVGFFQSASFWAADLHRCICEWEFLWS